MFKPIYLPSKGFYALYEYILETPVFVSLERKKNFDCLKKRSLRLYKKLLTQYTFMTCRILDHEGNIVYEPTQKDLLLQGNKRARVQTSKVKRKK